MFERKTLTRLAERYHVRKLMEHGAAEWQLSGAAAANLLGAVSKVLRVAG